MNIDDACRIIRRANDSFLNQNALETVDGVAEAVYVLKSYLEKARGDGKSIDELLISESLLLTPPGIRWVMAFVTSAESLEAARKRARTT
jgi:hypothetical protein